MTTPNPHFICPITQSVMKDPVIGSDGITYERSAIEQWFATGNMTSPVTRAPMDPADLRPNYALKALIEGGPAGPPPAAPPPPATPKPPITLTVTPRDPGTYHATISIPDEPAAAMPTLFIDVLDRSGSMGSPSVDQSHVTSDAALFSRADLVRHSVATQIELLRPQDELAVVLFDDQVSVALDPTPMDSMGRIAAKAVLPQITPRGGTNIWAGLHRALSIAAEPANCNKNIVIILQTDGESDPSLNPPRGIPATFRSWCDSHRHVRFTLHTAGYGFGSALDMPLLRELATVGCGTVNYIPDGSMVGTVFIHLMSNLMSCVYSGLTLHVPEAGLALPVGYLQTGQTKHMMFSSSATPTEVSITDATGKSLAVTIPATAPANASFAVALDGVTETLRHVLRFRESGGERGFTSLLANLSNALPADSRLQAFITDLADPDPAKGQISKALEPSAFSRWGRHYLPAVISGLEQQWPINFRDQIPTLFGSDSLRALIAKGDDIFNSLPPPEASCAYGAGRYAAAGGGGYAAAATPASMASVNTPYGPCFLPASLVTMADGSFRRCDQVKSGDITRGGVRVKCVIKTLVPFADVVDLRGVDFPVKGDVGGFTLWHPVFLNGQWQHPATLGPVTRTPTDAIYNFVMEDTHSIWVNGIQTCTMGHNFTGDAVIEHAYFGKRVDGKRNIRDDLEADPGWATGYITWQNLRVTHDAATGLISGMRPE
jgi:hypothetical protein